MNRLLKTISQLLHQTASPPYFYRLATRLLPWLTAIMLVMLAAGLYAGLYLAPTDYQQGDSYRIMFIHVPAAWMSLLIYTCMAALGAISLIWRIKLADIFLMSSAPIGTGFTIIALITGSLWGKPMWGTWWVWDARLTSELILLFLYWGIIGLYNAIEDSKTAAKAVAILTLVGVVNIPIIHYSVEWWNTLHQGPTVSKLERPSIHISMLIPLLLMAFAFQFYYLTAVLHRVRLTLLLRESHSRWVEQLNEKPI